MLENLVVPQKGILIRGQHHAKNIHLHKLWHLELFAKRQNYMFQKIRCVSGKTEDVQTAEISNTVEAFGCLVTCFRGYHASTKVFTLNSERNISWLILLCNIDLSHIY